MKALGVDRTWPPMSKRTKCTLLPQAPVLFDTTTEATYRRVYLGLGFQRDDSVTVTGGKPGSRLRVPEQQH